MTRPMGSSTGICAKTLGSIGPSPARLPVTSIDLDGANLHRVRVDPEMDLAPLAPPGGAVLASAPIAHTGCLDAGAVDQQMQRPRAWAVGDLDDAPARASAERTKVRDRPVQTCQPEEVFDYPSRLPQAKTKERV